MLPLTNEMTSSFFRHFLCKALFQIQLHLSFTHWMPLVKRWIYSFHLSSHHSMSSRLTLPVQLTHSFPGLSSSRCSAKAFCFVISFELTSSIICYSSHLFGYDGLV